MRPKISLLKYCCRNSVHARNSIMVYSFVSKFNVFPRRRPKPLFFTFWSPKGAKKSPYYFFWTVFAPPSDLEGSPKIVKIGQVTSKTCRRLKDALAFLPTRFRDRFRNAPGYHFDRFCMFFDRFLLVFSIDFKPKVMYFGTLFGYLFLAKQDQTRSNKINQDQNL